MTAQLVFDHRPPAVMAVNDSLIMIRRSSTHIIRNTDQLLGAFFQPIMFLVLFAAVFGGAISKALPPGTPDLADERDISPDLAQAGHRVVAHGGGVFDQLLLLDHPQTRDGGGHGEVVLAEGAGMDDAALHGVEDAVHDLRPGDDRPHRHEAAG